MTAVGDEYVPKMSYEDLSSLLDDIDSLYVDGQLSDEEYNEEWRAVIQMSGWTEEGFFMELDRRWGEPRTKTDEPREG